MPQTGWRVVQSWDNGRDTRRVVLHMRHETAGDVVLKQVQKERRPGLGMEMIDDHLALHDVFPLRLDLKIPALLAHDREALAVLMRHVDAPSAVTLLTEADDDRATHHQILRGIGRWLALFHKCRGTEQRPFTPGPILQYQWRVLRDLRKIGPSKPSLFRAFMEQTLDLGDTLKGQGTVSAQLHGDLNLGNFLIRDGMVTGIDFSATNRAAVGIDIGRILALYLTTQAPDETVERILPDWVADAFFSGYDIVGRDDPSVQLMMRVQLLNLWRTTPNDPEKLSFSQAMRLVRIQRIAEALT